MLRYAITDGTLQVSARQGQAAHGAFPLPAHCARLAREGVDFILIREKQLPSSDLVLLCRNVLAAVRAADASSNPATHPGTRVLVARRADIALAAGLDGVHLSAAPEELTPAQVRRLCGEQALVSVSCHTAAEVARARDAGASAILFGPVFGKQIAGREVVPGCGLDALRQACEAAHPVPLFALGGVQAGNAAQCFAAGAAGIAGIRLFAAGAPQPLS